MIWPLPAPILCFGHASFTPPSKIFSWFIEPCFSHDPHPFHQTTHLFIEPCFSIGPHPFHQTTNLFIQPCFFSLGYGLISSVVRSFVVSLKYTSHFFLMNHVFHITHIPSTKPPICLLNRAFHMTHTPSTKPPTCLLNHAFHMTHLFIEPCFSIGPHPFHQTTNLFIQPCFFSLGYGLISSVVLSFVVSLKYTSHFFL